MRGLMNTTRACGGAGAGSPLLGGWLRLEEAFEEECDWNRGENEDRN